MKLEPLSALESARSRLRVVPAQDRFSQHYDCPRCADRGFCILPSQTGGTFEHGPCPDCARGSLAAVDQEQRRVDALFGASGVPERYAEASLADFEDDPRLAEVEAALAGGHGLVLCGRNSFGCGKTHMAAAVLRQRLAEHVSGLFVKTPDLFTRFQETFDEHYVGPTQAQLLAGVRQVGVLVLDDVEKKKPGEWVLQVLYAIVDDRYNNRRQTILTSNLDWEGLSAWAGRAIVDRLTETCVWVNFDGLSRRLVGLEGARA